MWQSSSINIDELLEIQFFSSLNSRLIFLSILRDFFIARRIAWFHFFCLVKQHTHCISQIKRQEAWALPWKCWISHYIFRIELVSSGSRSFSFFFWEEATLREKKLSFVKEQKNNFHYACYLGFHSGFGLGLWLGWHLFLFFNTKLFLFQTERQNPNSVSLSKWLSLVFSLDYLSTTKEKKRDCLTF